MAFIAQKGVYPFNLHGITHPEDSSIPPRDPSDDRHGGVFGAFLKSKGAQKPSLFVPGFLIRVLDDMNGNSASRLFVGT